MPFFIPSYSSASNPAGQGLSLTKGLHSFYDTESQLSARTSWYAAVLQLSPASQLAQACSSGLSDLNADVLALCDRLAALFRPRCLVGWALMCGGALCRGRGGVRVPTTLRCIRHHTTRPVLSGVLGPMRQAGCLAPPHGDFGLISPELQDSAPGCFQGSAWTHAAGCGLPPGCKEEAKLKKE